MAPKSWQPHRNKRPSKPLTRFRPPDRAPDGPAILYGWHTVQAALENPARRIRGVLARENALRRLTDRGVALPVKPELARRSVIGSQRGPSALHQGLLAEAGPLPAPA